MDGVRLPPVEEGGRGRRENERIKDLTNFGTNGRTDEREGRQQQQQQSRRMKLKRSAAAECRKREPKALSNSYCLASRHSSIAIAPYKDTSHSISPFLSFPFHVDSTRLDSSFLVDPTKIKMKFKSLRRTRRIYN